MASRVNCQLDAKESTEESLEEMPWHGVAFRMAKSMLLMILDGVESGHLRSALSMHSRIRSPFLCREEQLNEAFYETLL